MPLYKSVSAAEQSLNRTGATKFMGSTGSRVLLFFGLWFTCMSLNSCRLGSPQEQDSKATAPSGDSASTLTLSKAQAEQVGIQLDSLTFLPLSRDMVLSGQIEAPPQNLISVSIPMSGTVRTTLLLPGMKVTKGQVLAVLEDMNYIRLQEEYLTVRLELEGQEKELVRLEDLYQAGAGQAKSVREAGIQTQKSRIRVRSLEEQLLLLGISVKNLNDRNISRSIEVRSPVNGFVTKVHHSTGHFVAAGEALFELVDPSDVHLRLNAFEKDLPYLAEGMEVLARNNAEQGEVHPAKILLVGKEFAADRSVEIHCHFDRYEPRLIPGMFMKGVVQGKGEPVATLPSAAVQNFKGQDYVFELVGEGASFRFRMHPVRLLHQSGGRSWLDFSPAEAKAVGPQQNPGPNHTRYAVRGSYALLMKAFNQAEEE